jgi:hypothetical protein
MKSNEVKPKSESNKNENQKNLIDYHQQKPVFQHFKNFFQFFISENDLEKSPYNGNIWLPLFVDEEMFVNCYINDAKLCNIVPYTSKNFVNLWSQHYKNIEIRGSKMICHYCYEFEVSISNYEDEDAKKVIKKEKELHLKKVNEARELHQSIIFHLCRSLHLKIILICGDGGDAILLPKLKVVPKELICVKHLSLHGYYLNVFDNSSNIYKKEYSFHYLNYDTEEGKAPSVVVQCFYNVLNYLGMNENKLIGKNFFK